MTSKFKEILICIFYSKSGVPQQNYSNKTDNCFFYSIELKCSVAMSKDKKQFIFHAHSLIASYPAKNYQVCQIRKG